ncbi:MBL fold metallo-hydrolase [Deinococcus roseus]|uniref:Metallo-beta-lactamase domain-containing protein n=1 Tax=Deinococcus roseus TaxID=392414 RepID=A0ABQ2DBP8_9DEIO|nr:MBL fold metallo-hydrolase [Deinococcus roseus]GGJ52582.1 hypothetical protein GCM10008938_43220 [Deinococcus roseus]
MELTFLGTAADSAYPLPFCACTICQQARGTGGKNIRRRSSVMVNRDLLIDLGPDSIQALLTFGFDPGQIRFLLQTHPHHDHFDPNHLITRIPDYGCIWASPLTLVASSGTLGRMSMMLQATGFEGDLVRAETQHLLNTEVHPLQAGESTTIGDHHITAFQANHDAAAESLLYAIQSGGRALLYATDTDTLLEPTQNQLSVSGLRFSLVVLDHTYGPGCDGGGHLNAERFRATMAWLREAGLLEDNAKIYATHLSHQGNPEHQELARYAHQHGYLIPWDGLTVRV